MFSFDVLMSGSYVYTLSKIKKRYETKQLTENTYIIDFYFIEYKYLLKFSYTKLKNRNFL